MTTDKLADPGHPLWSIIRLTVLMIALVSVLYLNASQFDDTELRTIITMFMVAGGAEGITQIVKGLRSGKD